jgi:hypothetical protein
MRIGSIVAIATVLFAFCLAMLANYWHSEALPLICGFILTPGWNLDSRTFRSQPERWSNFCGGCANRKHSYLRGIACISPVIDTIRKEERSRDVILML